ncbi:hypothetical protein DFH27DRAFT_476462 [Peziza echinospora]|nr:hypothetical protein DFH27DRAFT_476462 [Peziza echinospora]
MSLQKTYLNFLNSPRTAALSNSTTQFHYITTGHTVSGESIIDHLNKQKHQLEKKVEKVISAIETLDSIVLETETTIEFKTSGGSFLPGLDDNFLIDQKATFPLIHIVNFENGLISQIRLYWDQATLLKQMGVIGRTGRNWPIKDGPDQIKIIRKSVEQIPTPRPLEKAQEPDRQRDSQRDRGASNASVSSTSSIRPTPDPHSTLSLFTPHEPQDERTVWTNTNPRPRTSAKPPPRDLNELFVASDPDPAQARANQAAEAALPPKAPSKYNDDRSYDFLDGDNDQKKVNAPNHSIKTNPNKYEHFDMTDGPRQQKVNPPTKDPRNQSSWNFSDFSTPEKKQGREQFHDELPVGQGQGQGNLSSSGSARRDAAAYGLRDSQSSFTIADNSPAHKNKQKWEMPADRKAAVKSMNSHWGHDDEVEQLGGGARTIYKTSGDGMGGRKGAPSIWGTDADEEEQKPIPPKGGRKENYPLTANGRVAKENEPSSYWDF